MRRVLPQRQLWQMTFATPEGSSRPDRHRGQRGRLGHRTFAAGTTAHFLDLADSLLKVVQGNGAEEHGPLAMRMDRRRRQQREPQAHLHIRLASHPCRPHPFPEGRPGVRRDTHRILVSRVDHFRQPHAPPWAVAFVKRVQQVHEVHALGRIASDASRPHGVCHPAVPGARGEDGCQPQSPRFESCSGRSVKSLELRCGAHSAGASTTDFNSIPGHHLPVFGWNRTI